MKNKIFLTVIIIAAFFCIFICQNNIKALSYTEVKNFDELTEAISRGENVMLTNDIDTTNGVLTIDKSLTINLNGYAFSASEPSNINKTVIITGEETNVTIKDESKNKTGKIICTDTGTTPRIISIENKANLILESGMITNNNLSAQRGTSGVYVSDNCTFTMNGGSIVLNENTNSYGIALNIKGKGAKAIINNGIVEAKKGNAIVTSNGSANNITQVVINDGEIKSEGRAAISGSMGAYQEIVISGGVITSNNGSVSQGQNSIITIYGGKLNGNFVQNGTLTMNNGTINGDINVKQPLKMTINNGTINGNTTETNGEANISDNVTLVGNRTIISSIIKDKSDSSSILYFKMDGVNITKAEKGKTVSISAEPPFGYKVVGYTVYYKIGEVEKNVEVTNYNNYSTFQMPGYPVTVKAEYEEIVYDVIEGNDSKYTINSEKDLTFRINADYTLFEKVYIDGVELSTDMYTSKEGSTIITLLSKYLETLSKEEHELKVTFSDGGSSTAKFTLEEAMVENKKDEKISEIENNTNNTRNPSTGNNSIIYVMICFACIIVLIATDKLIKNLTF